MDQALQDLGFRYEEDQVIVPRRRSPRDITLPADVAEEVVRIVGYDTLTPQSIPTTIGHASPSIQPTLQSHIETILTQRYHADSVETYPRASDEMYEVFGIDAERLPTLQNPLQPEQSHLSHSLLYNLLYLIVKNHKFYDSLRPYTIGSVRAGERRPYADTW
jgi:phenylalanyl-tRNA synthetase beta chain